MHCFKKHGVRHEIRQYVGAESMCRVCKCDFKTRARLIKHLLDRRVRSKSKQDCCADIWLNRATEKIPESLLIELESQVAHEERQARKQGRRHVLAEQAAVPARKRTADQSEAKVAKPAKARRR